MPTEPAGGRGIVEVGLSLNGVFGRLTGYESMTGSGRAKFVSLMKTVGSWV